MKNSRFLEEGFILNGGKIEAITYAYFLTTYCGEDVCSPRGVESKYQVAKVLLDEDGERIDYTIGDFDTIIEGEGESIVYAVFKWSVGGRLEKNTTYYDSEEEANYSILDYFENSYLYKSFDHPFFYKSEDELITDLAERHERHEDVIRRYFRLQNFREQEKKRFKDQLELERKILAEKVKTEADKIMPLIDDVFRLERSEARSLPNEAKTKALSIAFKSFLARINFTITTDFWKVYNLIKNG